MMDAKRPECSEGEGMSALHSLHSSASPQTGMTFISPNLGSTGAWHGCGSKGVGPSTQTEVLYYLAFETQASSTPGPREARSQGSIKQLTLGATTLELDGQHSGAWGQDPCVRCQGLGKMAEKGGQVVSQRRLSTPVQWRSGRLPC